MKKNAQQHARSSVSKTGVLNVNKLHTYKFNDDLFKRVTVVPNGKNHGLVLFVDWSSSMVGTLMPTVKQVLNLVWFCKKVNIPFEVYGFSDAVHLDNAPDYVGACNYSDGDIVINSVHLLNFLSSRIKTNAFNDACLDLYALAHSVEYQYFGTPYNLQLSSTPLNDAIILAHDIVPKFQKSNGLEVVNTIFLTDGESNGLDYVKDGSTPSGIKQFRYSYSSWSRRTADKSFITDTVTKINYEITSRIDVTNHLLRSLHDRLGINVIGFFIVDRNPKNAIIDNILGDRYQYNHNELTKLSKQFNREKSLVVDNHKGYNEFYMIKGGKSLDTDNDGLEVADDVSKRVLTTAFKKHSKSKTVNKVILSRFIKMIA